MLMTTTGTNGSSTPYIDIRCPHMLTGVRTPCTGYTAPSTLATCATDTTLVSSDAAMPLGSDTVLHVLVHNV